MSDALRKLIEAVEAGSLANVSAKDIHDALGAHLQKRFWEAYQGGSLDAAKALHDKLLPGWCMDVRESVEGHIATMKEPVCDFDGAFLGRKCDGVSVENEARARLLAILKAKLSDPRRAVEGETGA